MAKACNIEDWERAVGVQCNQCKSETLRLIEGLCPECWARKQSEAEKRLGDKNLRRYYQRKLREGKITLAQMRQGDL